MHSDLMLAAGEETGKFVRVSLFDAHVMSIYTRSKQILSKSSRYRLKKRYRFATQYSGRTIRCRTSYCPRTTKGFTMELPSAPRNPVAVISIFKIAAFDVRRETKVPEKQPASAARFRKFACEPSHQGRGIGTRLLKHVFEVAASDLGCDVIWCDARLATAEWYERRGMSRFGEFLQGRLPYVRMKASLSH
ncbi:uncharacterized protein B0H18DRAFT_639771 [Fomitopsis serialis]|uniref:uncharacterized protein n=1 Tax=Fomitopsis serialis TaxID=139415 RepID=UPI002007D781|nr:uncharacterized protein B0H18DRAFT_639771 [Neoantrodia serialis]KAH9919335.1 hypothetical protein B0H18DRAFT_639771 [Neoantrodia serialis]